jgi:tetratricopeptide (TPR) repeat protein
MPTIPELVRDAYTHWDDAAVLADTGRELHDRNRLELARGILDRAVELDPSDWRSWAHRAYCDLRSLADDEGRTVLRRGVEATGDDRLRSVLAGFTDDDNERETLRAALEGSADLYVRADLEAVRLRGGDAEAYGRMKKMVAEHPDDADLRESMMWTLIGARQQGTVEGLDLREEGVPLADRQIAATPDRIRGYWMKVQMLFVEKDWNAILAATEQALARHPDEESMMHLRGRAYQEIGDLARALQCFARAIGAKPSFAGARTSLGKVYESQERYELAEEVFREIPRANPGYPGGPVSLALYLARRAQWEEAERLLVDAWPKLPAWIRAQLANDPVAKPLMERPAVKKATGAGNDG